MELELPLPSPKTCPDGSTWGTTHSGTSWERLSDMMLPCVRHSTGGGGQTRVWLMDPQAAPRGVLQTHNFSDSPNDAAVCSLSSVLEPTESILPRYYLSAKACAGILLRVTAEMARTATGKDAA